MDPTNDVHPRAARGRRIAAKLRSKQPVNDSQFDDLYTQPIRSMSPMYWTPVNVAMRAAAFLVAKPGARVLDVGSGAGKFCLVGALSTKGQFFGVEQRDKLVESARDVATLLDAENATFMLGLFATLDPAEYDAFYLFNPFEENLFAPSYRIDRTIPPMAGRFDDEVAAAQRFLAAAAPGARVATYNGMGASLPGEYTLVERVDFECPLELWVKQSPTAVAGPG